MNGRIAVLALLMAGSLQAQQEIGDIASLRAMRRAHVVVKVQDAAVQAGIDTAALRVQVELTLRRLGVVVIDLDEYLHPADSSARVETAMIFLSISASETVGYVGSHIEIDVRQYASLLREPKDVLRPVTWAMDEIGTIREGAFVEKTTDAVGLLLDHLSNDFLTANPVHH